MVYSPIFLSCITQAISKMRFLTDTMMNGEKMRMLFGNNAACQCGFSVENHFHQLLDCSIYSDLREFCISEMTNIIISKRACLAS